MEGIIVLAVIALAIFNISKRAKNASEKRPGQTETPRTSPGPRYASWREAFPDELREILNLDKEDDAQSEQAPVERQVTFDEVISRKAPEMYMSNSFEGESYQASNGSYFIPEGESRWDQDGCIGGSLPHEKAHPRTRAKQQNTIRNAAKPEQALTAQSSALSSAKLTPGQLRSAVVMAEILDRPVALRRRTYGR